MKELNHGGSITGITIPEADERAEGAEYACMK